MRVRPKEDSDPIDLIRVGRTLGESSGELDESGEDKLGGERVGVRGVENGVEEVDDVRLGDLRKDQTKRGAGRSV